MDLKADAHGFSYETYVLRTYQYLEIFQSLVGDLFHQNLKSVNGKTLIEPPDWRCMRLLLLVLLLFGPCLIRLQQSPCLSVEGYDPDVALLRP